MRTDQVESSLSMIKAMLQHSKGRDSKRKKEGFNWFYNRIERMLEMKETDLRICHLDQLPTFLQAASVQDRIKTVMLRSRRPPAVAGVSSNQFDFKQVLKRLLVKDFRWLLFIEFICFVLLYFFFMMVRQFVLSMLSYYDQVSRAQSQNVEKSKTGVFSLESTSMFIQMSLDHPIEEGNHFSITQTAISCLLGIFMYALYTAVEAVGNRLKVGLHTQVRSCLKLMIFEKLELADQKLLDQVDSSLISRLFHSEFEAFTSSFCNITSLLHMSFYSLIILVYYSKASMVFGYVMFFGTVVLIGLSLLCYKHTSSSLKTSLQKSEKLLFEVIQNFISLKYRKSEAYFKKKMSSALSQSLRDECIRDLMVSVIRTVISYLPAFFSIIDLHFFLNNDAWHALTDTHLKSAKLRIFLSNCLTFYIILIFFEYFMKKSIEACRHRLEGGESDKFFDSFFSISTLRQQSDRCNGDTDLQTGDIELHNCTASIRTSAFISEILDEFQTRAGDTTRGHLSFGHSINSANKSSINSWFAKAKQPRIKRPLRRLFLKTHTSISTRDCSEMTLRNVSIKIEKGSKICLYGEKDSGHYQLIHLIMGEGFIKSGQLKKSGTVSHLNTSSPLFLEAKTIFDNIVMGNRYDEHRYKRVLDCLGLSYSRYRGGDLYELTADASNMTHFDCKMILVARFLYQEADIYLIENLFREESSTLSSINLEAMFSDLLRDKTVLCITREQSIIKNCRQVVIFKNNTLSEVVSVDNFIYSMTLHQNIHDTNVYSLEDVDVEVRTKKFTFTKRLSNAMMFNSLNLDHELKLHKKNLLISQRATSTLKDSDLLEKLIYGIYLVQKRREDGKNTYNFCYDHKLPLVAADLNGWMKVKGFSGYMFWTLLVFTFMLHCVVELTIFFLYQLQLNKMADQTARAGTTHFTIDWPVVLVAALLLSMLVSLVMRIRVGRVLIKSTIELQEKVFEAIISSEYQEKQKLHQYMLLKIGGSCIADLLRSQLSTVPDLLWGTGWQMCEMLCLNILFPLYQLAVTLVLAWQTRSIVRSTMLLSKKLTPMRLKTEDRVSSFHFHLVKSLSFRRNMNDTESQRRLLSKMIDHSNLLYIFLTNDINSWCMLRTSIMNFVSVALTCSFLIISHLGYSLVSLKFGWVLFWGLKLCFQGSIQRKELSVSLAEFALHNTNSSSVQRYLDVVSTRQQQVRKSKRENKLLATAHKHGDLAVLLKNVFLSFGDSIVLKNLSLRVKRGEKVCLLGCEGVGKSTILNVIAGLISPDEEQKTQILVLGKSRVSSQDGEYLESVEVVEADPPLFEGTVRSNLDPAGEFSDEALIFVLHLFRPSDDADQEAGRSRVSHIFNPTLQSPCNTLKETRMQEAQRSARSLDLGQRPVPVIRTKASSRFISIKKQILGKLQQLSRRFRKQDGIIPPSDHHTKHRKHLKKATLAISNKTSVDRVAQRNKSELASIDMPSIAEEPHTMIKLHESIKAKTCLQQLGKGHNQASLVSPQKHETFSPPPKNLLIEHPNLASLQSSGDTSTFKTKPLLPSEADLDRERVHSRIFQFPDSKNGVLVEKIESIEEDSPSRMSKPMLRKLDPDYFSPDKRQKVQPLTDLKSQPAIKIQLIALSGRVTNRQLLAHAKSPILASAKIETKTPAKKQILNASSNSPIFRSKEQRKTDIKTEMLRGQPAIRQLLEKRKPSWHQGLNKEQLIKRIGLSSHQALSELLDAKVEVSGSNVGVESRRFISLCRCVLNRPSLLLVWEEGLKFGMGVGSNTKKLFEHLATSTVITNKKNNSHLLLYQKAFLVDAGSVVESGEPLQLMADRDSMCYNFLRETDPLGFRDLKKQLKQKQRDSMYQTFSLTQVSDESPLQGKQTDSSHEQIFISSINQQPIHPKIQVVPRLQTDLRAHPPLSSISINPNSEAVAADQPKKDYLTPPANQIKESMNKLTTERHPTAATLNPLSKPLTKIPTASRTTADIADEPSIKADHRLDSERQSSIKRPTDLHLKHL